MTEASEQPVRSATPQDRLWQRALIGALAAVIRLIHALPAWVAYALGDLLAVPWFIYWSLHDRRGVRSSGYWRNTRIAFRRGA